MPPHDPSRSAVANQQLYAGEGGSDNPLMRRPCCRVPSLPIFQQGDNQSARLPQGGVFLGFQPIRSSGDSQSQVGSVRQCATGRWWRQSSAITPLLLSGERRGLALLISVGLSL